MPSHILAAARRAPPPLAAVIRMAATSEYFAHAPEPVTPAYQRVIHRRGRRGRHTAHGSCMLSDFEQRRLKTIERNNAIMQGMGIPGLVPQELRARAQGAGAAARRRKRAAPPPEEDTRERRRSSRLANAPAIVFTTFDDDEDLGDNRQKSSSKRATALRTEADDGEVRTARAPVWTARCAALRASAARTLRTAAGSNAACRSQLRGRVRRCASTGQQ